MMEYIQRELERKFLSMSRVFKAVMVTGARQVGKSTMLKHLAADQNRAYVSMDNARDRELAQSDPKLFFQTYKPPVLIDEAQKAPELFETIKIICDNSDERGLFWLTGSQSKKLLKQAGDSLAGRICILRMFSLSQRELVHIFPEEPLDFAFASLQKRSSLFPENNILSTFSHIWLGGMPEMVNLNKEQAAEYWNSYIDTYLMRDAVDDNGITDIVAAKEWVKVLQNMGIVFLLEPYYNNELKRLVKTPKLYFCDTGLCAFLSSWTSRDALMNGAVAGHYFENYVVGEMLRTFSYGKNPAIFSFYRDKDQREIDLIVEQDGILHPLEIKKSAEPDRRTIKVFTVLQKGSREVGAGGIVCMTDSPYPIDRSNSFIPANLI